MAQKNKTAQDVTVERLAGELMELQKASEQPVTQTDIASLEQLLAGVENVASTLETIVVTPEPVQDTTDPTLPMGENGNALVEDITVPAEAPAPASITPVPAAPFTVAPGSFQAIVGAVPADAVESFVKDVTIAFDRRKQHETAKNAGNTSIQDKLDKAKAKFTNPALAALMIAANVKPDFMLTGSATPVYNVYAMEKLADILTALGSGFMRNKINNAIMRSLFKFRAAGVTFTNELAEAAVSDKVKVSAAMKEHLVRHTVSEATVSTQKSSTLAALSATGIIRTIGGGKNAHYELTDTPQTVRMQEVLAA